MWRLLAGPITSMISGRKFRFPTLFPHARLRSVLSIYILSSSCICLFSVFIFTLTSREWWVFQVWPFYAIFQSREIFFPAREILFPAFRAFCAHCVVGLPRLGLLVVVIASTVNQVTSPRARQNIAHLLTSSPSPRSPLLFPQAANSS